MKVLRVRHADQTFYAQLLPEKNAVVCLDQSLGLTDPVPLGELAVLPPLSPSKVVCVLDNYRSRLEQEGRQAPEAPRLFLRPPTAVVGIGQHIVLPRGVSRVAPGGELAVIIGRACRHITPEAVPAYLFGYSCANGLMAPDLLAQDGCPGRAAGFDGFAAVGPWIETAVADPAALPLRTLRNGQPVQEGTTADMVFAPLDLVSRITSVMTLLPGDVVLTGTPAGGEPLAAGDELRVEIADVGVLINTVVAEPETLQ